MWNAIATYLWWWRGREDSIGIQKLRDENKLVCIGIEFESKIWTLKPWREEYLKDKLPFVEHDAKRKEAWKSRQEECAQY